MRRSEEVRKDGGKRVKFDGDKPANERIVVEEKRRNDGTKKITFNTRPKDASR